MAENGTTRPASDLIPQRPLSDSATHSIAERINVHERVTTKTRRSWAGIAGNVILLLPLTLSALTVESPVARFPLSGLLRKLDSNMALEENNWIPAAVFGGSLVLLGAGMMYGHARAWQQQRADESLEDADRQHLRNRYLRRMQTSAVVAFTGCLIGIGDAFIWQLGPAVATFYWLFVIMLVFWIALLALGDLTSIRTHSQTAMTQLEATRTELESELAKHRHRSNGKPTQRITNDLPDSPKQNQPNTLQEPR